MKLSLVHVVVQVQPLKKPKVNVVSNPQMGLLAVIKVIPKRIILKKRAVAKS